MSIIQPKTVISTDGLLEWEYVDENSCRRFYQDYILIILRRVNSKSTYYEFVPTIHLRLKVGMLDTISSYRLSYGEAKPTFQEAEYQFIHMTLTLQNSVNKLTQSYSEDIKCSSLKPAS